MVALLTSAEAIREAIRDRALLDPDAVVGVCAPHAALSTRQMGEQRTLIGTATTDDVDCEEEVVLPDGANTAYIEQNRQVFADHHWTVPHTVGTLRRLQREGNGWSVRIELYRGMRSPLADDVWAIASQGGIGLSIGFQALDYGEPTADEAKRWPRAKSVVRKWRWLELSVTPFPCNVSCRASAVRVDESRAALIEDLRSKGLLTPHSARWLTVRRTPASDADMQRSASDPVIVRVTPRTVVVHATRDV